MRALLYYIFPMILIGVFIFIMAASPLLKHSMTQNDHVSAYITKVKSDVKKAEWHQAAADQRRLKTSWEHVIPRIQIGIEKKELEHINVNLARLSGFIEAHAKPGALAELAELRMHWDHLGF